MKDVSSEKQFENYVKKTLREKHRQESIRRAGRGKKIFELMNRFGQNSTERLVLDLGCGRGDISLFLSRKTKCVVGVDINKESIGVAHLRAKISNRNNFLTIRSSATNIPVRTDSLDFVLIIGVLEWVPCSKRHENPESTQLEALREVRRVLRRRGILLLAIENRYYLRYWLGLMDHHSRLRFVPVLPRKIADFISKRKKGELYLNRTYSYIELKKMIREVGFKTIAIHVGIPDYVFPEEIVDINDRDEIERKVNSIRQRKSRKILWRAINKIGLMRFLGSNFIAACEK